MVAMIRIVIEIKKSFSHCIKPFSFCSMFILHSAGYSHLSYILRRDQSSYSDHNHFKVHLFFFFDPVNIACIDPHQKTSKWCIVVREVFFSLFKDHMRRLSSFSCKFHTLWSDLYDIFYDLVVFRKFIV